MRHYFLTEALGLHETADVIKSLMWADMTQSMSAFSGLDLLNPKHDPRITPEYANVMQQMLTDSVEQRQHS